MKTLKKKNQKENQSKGMPIANLKILTAKKH